MSETKDHKQNDQNDSGHNRPNDEDYAGQGLEPGPYGKAAVAAAKSRKSKK